MNFLETEITPASMIAYKVKIQNEIYIEEHLLRISSLLENMLKIYDYQKLIVMGFNDFKYNFQYVAPEEEQLTQKQTPIHELVKSLPKNHLSLIVKVQSRMRTYIWRAKANLLKQKKRLCVKSFTVVHVSHDYLRVFVMQDRVTKKKEVYCRIESKKARTNTLPQSAAITRQLGDPCQENFFEIYQLNLEKKQLLFSDEGNYWINKENDDLRTRKKITLKRMNKAATFIQRKIRFYLFIKEVRIRYIGKLRKKQKNSSAVSTSLVRKVAIQGEKPIKRAYYMNFILMTEEVQDSTGSMSSFLASSFQAQKVTKQSILINTKPLEHSYSREHVQPFSQELFYFIEITDMIGIAYKMLDIATVAKGRQNMLKLDVKNLEEVQGMIINQQKKQAGLKSSRKDDQLEARRIFNVQNQRKKQLFQNTNYFTYAASPEDDNIVFKKRKGQWASKIDNYFTILLKGYQNFKALKFQKRFKSLKVQEYDQESISNYIRVFNPISEYGYGLEDPSEGMRAVDFLEEIRRAEYNKIIFEEQRRENEDNERVRFEEEEKMKKQKMEQARLMLYSDYCVVSYQRVYLTVVFNRLLEQVFIAARGEGSSSFTRSDSMLSISDSSQLQLHLDLAMLLPGGKVNLSFLKEHIEYMIVKQLQMDEDGLYFVPDQFTQLSMLQEQINWEEQQLQLLDISTISGGNNYGLESIFRAGVNSAKTTIQNLQEINKQVILLGNFEREERFNCEYLYNLSDNQLILTIYFLADLKLRKMYVVPVQEFECRYLCDSVRDKTPSKIQCFLSGIIEAIEGNLKIQTGKSSKGSREIRTNFSGFRPFLATMFKEQFLVRIQNKVRVGKIRRSYEVVRSYKNKEVFLQRDILNFEGRYIEVGFYLIKQEYELKFIVKELNAIDGNGNMISRMKKTSSQAEFHTLAFKVDLLEVQERTVMTNLIASMSDTQKDYFFRVNPEKWLDMQAVHTKEFYRILFSPLVRLIQESLRITYPSTLRMKVYFSNKCLPVHQKAFMSRDEQKRIKEMHVPDNRLYNIMQAVAKVQNAFKRMKQQQWFKMANERRLAMEIKIRQLGQFVKRTVKRINEKIYIVNTYRRLEKDVNQEFLAFDLIPYTDCKADRRNIKKRFRGQYNQKLIIIRFYSLDPRMMINMGQLSVYDYLIDQIYLDQGILKFKQTDFYTLDKLLEIASRSQLINQPLQPDQQSTFVDQLMAPEKLVHHSHHRDYIQEGQLIPETIYNVVYTGSTTLRAKKNDQLNQNTVWIEVNLNNVKKLYPTLNTFDNDVMKLIGKQLIDGIKINDEGQLLVDHKKINPTFIQVTASDLVKHDSSIQSEEQLTNLNKHAFVKILVKKTTYYSNKKFLIIINFIERKITKILPEDVDQVFEEYESLYQILANNLNNKKEAPLIWELSPEEARTLSHQREKIDIAHELVKRVLIINGKFIFLAESKQDIQDLRSNYPNVILFLEKGIKPIQQKFRNREFSKNYKSFREQLSMWKDSQGNFIPQVMRKLINCFQLALYNLDSLKSSLQFVVICGEDRGKHLVLNAYNMQSFKKYEFEFPKQKYQQLFMQSKRATLIVLSRYIEYSMDKDNLIFKPGSNEEIFERFSQQLRDLKEKAQQGQKNLITPSQELQD